MAKMFDIVVENVVLNAKSTILEEAAGTPAGDRYVYIVESAGDVIKKAKEFVVKNKGKLAALAALGAGGAVAHNQGWLAKPAQLGADVADKLGLDNVADKLGDYARDQRITAGDASVGDYVGKGLDNVGNFVKGIFN